MNADKWVHPTRFTGEYPDGWNGYTFLDWDPNNKVYHPGEDYNLGYGDDDLGQEVVATASGMVFHKSLSSSGYGNLLIIKHTLGYNLKRFILEKYGIDTNELYSLYGHCQSISVKEGDEVTCGQVVGKVGKSGTQWAHLHFEIYSLWKDLKNTSYRFYPVGWSKEKIQENYLPAYYFIEASKNLDDSTYLGKSKDYWLQVEADRENLMKQLGVKDQECLKIKQGLQEQIDLKTEEFEQLNTESAKTIKELDNALISVKKDYEKLQGELTTKQTDLNTCKTEKAILIAEQSEKYKAWDALVLFIKTLINSVRGGESK